MAQLIRITAKKEGFRRAGIAHPTTPTEYADDAFTVEQLAALRKEPMLVVETLPDPESKPPRKPKAKGEAGGNGSGSEDDDDKPPVIDPPPPDETP